MFEWDEDALCQRFVSVICDTPRFRESRKIRQILPWVGLVIAGVRRCCHDIAPYQKRQLSFWCGQRRFKAKFVHAGLRSGIRIVEMLFGPGNPLGGEMFFIGSLSDAERFYNESDRILRAPATKGVGHDDDREETTSQNAEDPGTAEVRGRGQVTARGLAAHLQRPDSHLRGPALA